VRAAEERRRVLRFAHLTDTHVQPERRAGEGLTRALAHAQAQPMKPELVVTGGDLIMDSFEADDARTRVQWELFNKVWRESCAVPTMHCLGNHDCWGFHKGRSKTTGSEPNWGKRRALEALGMARPYHAFERAGWKFIVLDSTFPDGDGYIARLDDEQFEWLKGELEATARTTPVVVVSHMSIVTATALFNGKEEVKRDRPIPSGLMHVDAKRIVNLFRKHPGVRLALSGHMHLNDRVDLHGVTYICAGAVSGAWWKGPNDGCREGYTLVDLFSDGTFEYAYVDYGWKAEPA
jgi:3',5'-cyclic AMP phosphodiesterase CpdA